MAHPSPPPPVPDQPPPPAYGAPPAHPPAAAAVTGTNKFAVPALVCGILAPCLGMLSIIFAIIALVQIRGSGGQKGKGLAIGGLVATGVWAVVIVVVAAFGLANLGVDRNADGEIDSAGRVLVDTLRPGDCIEELSEGAAGASLPGVPCSAPHRAEVYGLFDVDDGDWPGDTALVAEAEAGCVELLLDYSPTAFDDLDVEIFYLHPTRLTWRTGDREIICLAYYLDGPRTGSIARS